ncbi:MAG: PKD domain-containing protein, partial [Bacteroidia bacterium]|nr:PKD domain-containing protein [Bacteroidia bacterium]
MKKVVLTLVATFALLLSSVPWSSGQTFSTARIDIGNGCANVFNCLARSSQDTIYGMWRDGSGSSAIYKLLKWNGSSWTQVGSFNMSQVTATTPFDNASDDVSLAIDASGNFHAAIRGIQNAACCSQERGICYAYSTNGTSWTFTNVDSYTDPSGWKNLDDPIIKIDKNGDPHIVAQFRDARSPTSFDGQTGLDRVYALMHYKLTTSWSKDIVFWQSGASNEVDEFGFDLDTNDRPHVAFLRERNGSGRDGSLFYIYDSAGSGGWSTAKLLIAGSTGAQEGTNPTLIVDKNNKVHIISYNHSGAIKLSTNTSGSFSTTTLSGGIAGSVRIGAFSMNDKGDQYLSFISSSTGNLTMALKASSSSSWTTSTIATNNGSYYSSMIGNNGRLMTLYSHRPSGSCSSIHRELWYGTSTFSTCTDATTPTISISPSSACSGTSRTISVTAGSLNDATSWKLYTGSCGGTQIDTTTGTTFTVSPTSTTQYWVRGSGGCATPSACDNATATVTTPGNASFSYGSSSYCTNDSDPTPSTSGSGTFSSTAGLVFVSTSTGQIDVSASTPGTYTVTHTVNPCAATANASITIGAPSVATISPNVCDSYTSPSGKTWTTTGTYMDTIPNAANCDSVITVNLTIRNKTFATINPDVCDSYTSPSGKTWTTSNTYMDTIPNAANCDSVITVNLTIRTKTTSSMTLYLCASSYTSPSGKTWTTTGTYNDTIPNAANCDSIITINLNLVPHAFSTGFALNPAKGCRLPHTVFFTDQSQFPDTWRWDFGDGNSSTLQNPIHNYTSYGSYTVQLITSDTIYGCLDTAYSSVNVHAPTAATISADECDSYTSPSGKTWTTTGTYTDTIPNGIGCDSIITVNLTIRRSTTALINPDVCDSYTSP